MYNLRLLFKSVCEKKLLYHFLFLLLLLSGYSKDEFRLYDHQIVGSWRIADIDRYGIVARDNLPFEETGRFTFSEDGQVTYEFNGLFKGSWDIIRRRDGEDGMHHALQLTVVDFCNHGCFPTISITCSLPAPTALPSFWNMVPVPMCTISKEKK